MEKSVPVHAGPALGAFGQLTGIGRWVTARRERRSLRAARYAADTELLLGRGVPLRLAWRAEELVTTKSRLDLAHELRSLVRHASARLLPAASPVNRGAVRVESPVLLEVADRLADLDRPVAARGVVVLRRLLDDRDGPLYDRDRARELGSDLDAALDALEPR
jgi:hypothetical protein